MRNQSGDIQIDERDEALIRLLEADSRLPAVTLAKRLGVSRSTVQARIDRLIAQGAIEGFTIRLGDRLSGTRVSGHVLITAVPKSSRQIEAKLRAIPQVRALHSVSGAFDMIAMVQAASIEELDAVIDDIGLIEGVERTNSSIILSTKFTR